MLMMLRTDPVCKTGIPITCGWIRVRCISDVICQMSNAQQHVDRPHGVIYNTEHKQIDVGFMFSK